MYRKYIEDLKKWYSSDNRKPLILWGARQIGKSYLLRDLFAKEYFKGKYIYIDCKDDYAFTNYCLEHPNAKEVINYIALHNDKTIDKDTLIIFDEAQECLPIVSMMKYFCQDYREIPIIVTGSMVRLKIKRTNNKRGEKKQQFLFPIGKINQITMYPLNFEEYLINKNKNLYDVIKQSIIDKKSLDDDTHKLAIENLYDYLLIGGMPEAVDYFIKTGNYQGTREILKELYDNYLGDMDLYQASPESIVRSRSIFKNIFEQLNKESKNFKFSMIEEKAKARDLASPIDWLCLAHLTLKSSNVKERVTYPLTPSSDSIYRLYLSDMGMFTYQSKINPTSFIDNNYRNTLSGVFFENYVALELVNAGFELFYWTGKGDSEFEFMIQVSEKTIPIDVKKNRGTLNSLTKYKEHNHLDMAIKVSLNKYGYDEINNILTIPLYSLPFYLNDINTKTNQIEVNL